MSNIIKFPTKAVRDWAIIERAIVDELQRLRVSPTAESRIVEQVRNTYDLLDGFDLSMPVEFPGSIPADQVAIMCTDIGQRISAAIKEHLHTMTSRILIDRLHRELQVCRELGLI
jgi:hypothetical protein